MRKIDTLSYHKYVDVYLDHFKVTFPIDLNIKHPFVNSISFLTNKDADLHVCIVKCNFIVKRNAHLCLKSCLEHKSNQIHKHGDLEQNFFKSFQFLFDNFKSCMVFF